MVRDNSDYGMALYLLMDNAPEQRLDIHMPLSWYLKLKETWSKFKAEALAYGSDSLHKQIATVVTIQRALHDIATAEIVPRHSVMKHLSTRTCAAARRKI
ncbi:hypothetical protein V1506DRAFT_458411 [Lipomyces tetrasporus]